MELLSELERKRDQTQAALAQRLDLLEQRVFAPIREVKDTVKKTLDLDKQVKNFPLLSLGLSTLLGYALGSVGSRSATSRRGAPGMARAAETNHSSGVTDRLLKDVIPAIASNLVLYWVKDLGNWLKADREQ